MTSKLKTYEINLKLKQPGYNQIIKTTVQAINPTMAKKIAEGQYGLGTVIGNPKERK